jgi:hypothetical protein
MPSFSALLPRPVSQLQTNYPPVARTMLFNELSHQIILSKINNYIG